MVFFMMSVATTIYTNLDTVMLGFMKDDTEVGYYTASVKVKSILVSFVTALSTVLLPRVSYYIEHGLKEEFQKVSRKALNFVVVVAVPVVVYFTLYAKESILLLSGTEFMGAVEPMKIIMPTVLFIGITNVLGIQILVPLGREMAVCISVMVGAVVDLMINAAVSYTHLYRLNPNRITAKAIFYKKSVDTFWVTELCLNELPRFKVSYDQRAYEYLLRQSLMNETRIKKQGKKIREAVFVLTSELMKNYFSGFSSKDSKMKKIEIALRNRQFIQFELSKLYL